MRNNIAALRHPTIQKKLRHTIWLAKLAAHAAKKRTGTVGVSKQNYVQNRHGRNIMRIDYYTDKGLTVWGDSSHNITDMVKQALEQGK